MELETYFDYTIKILILGKSGVGKTNILTMFMDKKFNQSHMTTSGIDLKTTSIELNNRKLRIQLWDTCGQEKYKSITKNLFLKVQGILAVYDITNRNSFSILKNWINSIKSDGNHPKMLIIGNKIDLNEIREVPKDEAIEYAKEEKIEYIETSSKTGENINKAITLICEKIMDNSSFEKDASFALDTSSVLRKNRHKCC